MVAPGRSAHFFRDLESGRSGKLRLDDIRSHFLALGASVRVTAWWNGAALDRILDERHAAIVDALVKLLRSLGWLVEPEVSFSDYGERGSIDVFGANREARAVFVGEAKSEWGSIEETLRRLSIKTRLAPKIAERVFGFRPAVIASVLVFPDDRTARRVADRYAATLDAAYPSRSREVRQWLHQPAASLRGLWFLTDARPDDAQRKPQSPNPPNSA